MQKIKEINWKPKVGDLVLINWSENFWKKRCENDSTALHVRKKAIGSISRIKRISEYGYGFFYVEDYDFMLYKYEVFLIKEEMLEMWLPKFGDEVLVRNFDLLKSEFKNKISKIFNSSFQHLNKTYALEIDHGKHSFPKKWLIPLSCLRKDKKLKKKKAIKKIRNKCKSNIFSFFKLNRKIRRN